MGMKCVRGSLLGHEAGSTAGQDGYKGQKTAPREGGVAYKKRVVKTGGGERVGDILRDRRGAARGTVHPAPPSGGAVRDGAALGGQEAETGAGAVGRRSRTFRPLKTAVRRESMVTPERSPTTASAPSAKKSWSLVEAV